MTSSAIVANPKYPCCGATVRFKKGQDEIGVPYPRRCRCGAKWTVTRKPARKGLENELHILVWKEQEAK